MSIDRLILRKCSAGGSDKGGIEVVADGGFFAERAGFGQRGILDDQGDAHAAFMQ